MKSKTREKFIYTGALIVASWNEADYDGCRGIQCLEIKKIFQASQRKSLISPHSRLSIEVFSSVDQVHSKQNKILVIPT